MARSGRCEILAARRARVAGAEVQIAMRLDRSATIAFIQELAASIGMRATLAPIDDQGGAA